MNYRTLRLPSRLLALSALMSALTYAAVAQTVIGGTTPDPQRALHVIKTGTMTDPLRLSGLRESTTLDQVLVVDPVTGVPMYRDAASLTTEGEWADDASSAYIYARRAREEGAAADVVIRDNGRVGIGTTNPFDAMHVRGGNLLVQTLNGSGLPTSGMVYLGEYGPRTTDVSRGVQASFDTDFAYFGMRNSGAAANDHEAVVQWGDDLGDDFVLSHYDFFTGSTRDALRVEGDNLFVGIGTATPTARLDVEGRARVRDLPDGDVDGVGADDRIVTADAAGNLREVDASALMSGGDTEWSYNTSVQGIYATRAAEADGIGGTGEDFVITDAGQMGIGMSPNKSGLLLMVDGTTHINGSNRLQFRDGTNAIYSSGSNNNWYFKGQSYVVFRNRDNDADLLTVQANSERVGIKERDPAVDFEVNGTQRMSASNRLQFGSAFNEVYQRNINDWRFSPQTQLNVMNRAESNYVLSVDANTEEVGIRTNDPKAMLHVYATGDRVNATRGNGVNIGSDAVYLALDENEIQAFTNSPVTASTLNLQADGGNVVIGVNNGANSTLRAYGNAYLATNSAAQLVGIGTAAPTHKLDVNGDARIRSLPDVKDDPFVVTADGNGNLTRRPALELASVHWTQTADGEIYNTTLNNVGVNNTNPLVAFDVGGTALIRDRLWMGSTDPRFIGDPLPAGINPGMHPTDGAIWVPTYTGFQTSNLRLYIPNDADDRFSIWGNNCAQGDCGDMFRSTRVADFRGDGAITFDTRLGINTEPDANKVLHTDGQIRFEDVDITPNNGNNYRILLVDDNGNLYRSSRTTNGNTRFHDPRGPQATGRTRGGTRGELNADAAGEVEALRGQLASAKTERDALAARNADLERRLARIEEQLQARASVD